MFDYSDRLAGLDDMVLQINIPSNMLPSAGPKSGLDGQPYIDAKKVKTRKGRRAGRSPLADKTPINNKTVPCPVQPTAIKARSEDVPVSSLPQKRSRPTSHSFKPLPAVPSASTLQLPSFLNFSSQLSIRPSPPVLQQSTPKQHTSVLFQPPSSARTTSRRRVVIQRSTHKKVHEGPLFIPAFHHPNSPYVPWDDLDRRRILPLAAELTSAPNSSHPSLCNVEKPQGAPKLSVEPEPIKKVGKLSTTWTRLKVTVKGSLKTALSHIGKPNNSPRGKKETLHTCLPSCKANNTSDHGMTFAENPSPSSPTSQCSRTRLIRTSLASFASSDSSTLAAWIAVRRESSETTRNTDQEISLNDYEVRGSWLDLSRGEGEWPCGVPDCDLHTLDGSPNSTCQGLKIFRTTMPFDRTHETSLTPIRVQVPSPAFSSDFHPTPPQFYSLPRLPSQCFELKPGSMEHLALDNAGPTLLAKKSRDLSMPGGWTFTS
ncbi:hypothetical protein BJ138DRAFT_1141938 [Hygrophoropsis aurantiaca]|uniref:Uncharacterized protein n=1 Tax=Hygrophoropsis aurantiaca TaxID=72124 RepID=A0ACB8APQ2_9AGAM|nr:hypothetical protein BJ138DRAFT_1141938 [Hygrophoropsis aurantiaca]